MNLASSALYVITILALSLSIIMTGLLLNDTVRRLEALEHRIEVLEAKPLPSGNTGRIGAIE